MTSETIVNPMFFTLGEAAKQSGLSKATISRAIRDGKLSALRSADTNSFKIDPSELHRYTEAVQVVRNTVAKKDEEQAATHYYSTKEPAETDHETLLRGARERAELEARAQLAEERLADLKATLEEMREHQNDLKRQRDSWQSQAERLLLTYQQTPQPTDQQPAQSERRGLFRWFRRPPSSKQMVA